MVFGKNPSTLSRRELFQVGAGGAALMMTGLTRPALAQSSSSELLVTAGGGDWGTMLKKAYFDGFAEQTGVSVNHQPYRGLAELKAIVDARSWGQADILLMSAGEAAMAEAQGLSEQIDYSVVNRDDLIEGAASNNYFLVNVAASVLTWNTQAMSEETAPTSWADFFNPVNKAPRGLFKNANQTLEVALLGAGVPLDKLYPLDIDLALKTLDGVRDTIRWYEGGAQAQQMIASGEIDWAMMWINRADGLMADSVPIKYLLENTVLDGDAVVIPKGHPNKDKAMKFAAYMATPEPQARLTNLVALGPTNHQAVPLCEPERLAKTASAPELAGLNRFQDFAWLAENSGRLTDAFNKWLIG